ncbi:hypothetical protein EOI86_01260 [Hwanghaeella grinnelliae]|uniref:Pentapeptide repeat-containing protein n=1 Tax=Hwanghaeella grinnelliae TaxID=2500179 RepID=A0A437QTY9_9PROT|nr:pentapeptide repeat-containing protein [Hwanghaeella grinnelliae]RVU37963.1 hypothetical protein EOI86_01260 [Hwanghaeella grinnelliae]
MNREETWGLFKQGKEAWNAWADEMLTQRKAFAEEGAWPEGKRPPEGNDQIDAWQAQARADFSEQEFGKGDGDFNDFVFPFRADFSEATLKGNAAFSGATFKGDADFIGATFTGNAGFGGATFKGNAYFSGATFKGDADFIGATFTGNAGFGGATFKGNAYFIGATFTGNAGFGGATFTGDADFIGATFKGDADFIGATFTGNAGFGGATFEGGAGFGGATFKGNAYFIGATFTGNAGFGGATFEGGAGFSAGTFSGTTSFRDARFLGEYADVSFEAAKSERAFTLQGSTFATVPDFSQMDFNQAPRVDNLRLHPRRLGRLWRFYHGDPRDNRPFGERLMTGTLSVFKGRNRAEPNNLAARYRALRRLADEGHDHKLEQEFFADELRAHQFHDYWFLHPQLYAIWIYEALSNIGRSLVLPLAWMAFCLFLFTGVYLQASQSKDFGYLSALQSIAGAASPELECASDGKYDRDLQRPVFERLPGDPVSSAWSLSARNSLIFAGGVLGQTNRQIQACLYGVQNIGGRKEPAVPTFVAVMGTTQTILSLILIFLFGLALRNNFKIG